MAKTKEQKAADAAKGTPFVSLDADVTSALYRVTRSASNKIQKLSGETDFADYSGGKTVATAVGEAINALDVTGSVSVIHSRHDFQPSSPDVQNLQVQLGGSAGNYRVGKGDTSSTVVVINQKLWDAMVAADPARWKMVLQAAHRESFQNRTRVQVNAPAN